MEQYLYPSKREAYMGLIGEATSRNFPYTNPTRDAIHSIYWHELDNRQWDTTSIISDEVTSLINRMRIELDNIGKIENKTPHRINYHLNKTCDYFDEFGEGKFS